MSKLVSKFACAWLFLRHQIPNTALLSELGSGRVLCDWQLLQMGAGLCDWQLLQMRAGPLGREKTLIVRSGLEVAEKERTQC